MDSDSASSADYSSAEDVDDDYDDDIAPASPSSQSSRFSRASSFTKRRKNGTHLIYSICVWLLLPARLILGIPFYLYSLFFSGGLKGTTSSPGRFQTSHVHAGRRALDHVVQRATDRRRGVIEVHLYTI